MMEKSKSLLDWKTEYTRGDDLNPLNQEATSLHPLVGLRALPLCSYGLLGTSLQQHLEDIESMCLEVCSPIWHKLLEDRDINFFI